MSALRVLLVARDPVLRAGLTDVLDGQDDQDVEVCDAVDDVPSALRRAAQERPDVCLIAAEGVDNLAGAVRAVRRASPRTVVLTLGEACRSTEELSEILRAGASGCVSPDICPGRLGRALRAAWEGEPVIPRRLAAQLLRVGSTTTPVGLRARLPNGNELTDREVEVLQLLAEGHSTAGIARRLYLSPVTVRAHVASATHRLEAADRAELTRLLDDARGQA